MTLLGFLQVSLRSRRTMVTLATAGLFISLCLLLLLEKATQALDNHFQKTTGGVHLLVGPRGSETDLLLQGLFFQGQAQNTLPQVLAKQWRRDARIAEIASFSSGDSYRGHPVVAIEPAFFTSMAPGAPLKPTMGHLPEKPADVLAGAQVARKLNLKLHDEIHLTHGAASSSIMAEYNEHDEITFTVTGILPATGTALDRALYIHPDAMELLHDNHNHHQQPKVNGFYLRLNNPRDILTLKWELQQQKEEPLTAILPAMTLASLREQIATAETVLFALSVLVFLSSLLTLGLFMTVLLRERQKEMAILRALGASRLKIALLVLFESWLVCTVASLVAVLAVNGLILLTTEKLFELTGFPLMSLGLSLREIFILSAGWFTVTLAAIVPVIILYRRSLSRGLQS